jgi:lipopolysaccharide biosynthesis regulator YciM
MRLGLTGKAEQQFLSLLEETGVNNPTHLMNLLISFISTHHSKEAVNYAQQREQAKQKEA